MFLDWPMGALRHRLRRVLGAFWLLPILFSLTGLALAWTVLRVEEWAPVVGWMEHLAFFRLEPDSARTVLSTVAGATISAASVVYSLVLLVRTIATGTLGPRLVEAFEHSTSGRFALGIQLAVFLYCLSILYLVGGEIDRRTISVAGAILGGIAALISLVLFVHAAARAVNVDTTIAQVADQLRASIADAESRTHGAQVSEPAVEEPGPALLARRSGYIQTIDRLSLARLTARLGGAAVLVVRSGDFVVEGTVVMRLSGGRAPHEGETRRLLETVVLGTHRTDEDDPRFSLQLLVEIALRALSAGVNDVYTAIACADHLAAILSGLAGRNLTPAVVRDRDGTPRVFSAELTFQDLADAVFHPLRQSGARDTMMAMALLKRLIDIMAVVKNEEARESLRGHAELIARQAREAAQADVDRRAIDDLLAGVAREAAEPSRARLPGGLVSAKCLP